MIPFPTADEVWPSRSAVWRLCVLPHPARERGLQRLLDQARKAMAPFPLAEVADADLNIGICPVELPNQGTGEQLRRDLSAALTAHLAGIAPFTMPVGTARVGTGSVLVELEPGRWPDLTARLTAALSDVLDHGELGPVHARPHLTIGYGAGHCDSVEIAAALHTKLGTRSAEVLVDAVHLLEVRQDAAGHCYRLAAPVITVPLGAARPVFRGSEAR